MCILRHACRFQCMSSTASWYSKVSSLSLVIAGKASHGYFLQCWQITVPLSQISFLKSFANTLASVTLWCVLSPCHSFRLAIFIFIMLSDNTAAMMLSSLSSTHALLPKCERAEICNQNLLLPIYAEDFKYFSILRFVSSTSIVSLIIKLCFAQWI